MTLDSASKPTAAERAAGRLPVVGMVGGGQLARMTARAAIDLGLSLRVLAAAPIDSAALVAAGAEVGGYDDPEALRRFAAGCDVVTFDHEHVPADGLAALAAAGAAVRPGAAALAYAQDKRLMRERLSALGLPVPRWTPVRDADDLERLAEQVRGWPLVCKAVRGGYDGRGVWEVASAAEAGPLLAGGLDLIAEERVPLVRELAAVVARSPSGQAAAWPVVETVQRDGICREVLAPAPGLDPGTALHAERLALQIAADLEVVGVLAVELFETSDGELLVNELAMRPHNSGHWGIEGSRTSQFEQHLRAVLDWPLGSTAATAPYAVMANVLGGSDPDLPGRLAHVLARDPAVKVHLYGKAVRPGRKVGHVTALGDDVGAVRARAVEAAAYLRGEPG